MVDTTIDRDRQAARTTYVVQRLVDRDEIRSLLAPERAYAAYALAQLEPGLFELSEWYTATGPEGPALVVHSRSGLGRALFALGLLHNPLDEILDHAVVNVGLKQRRPHLAETFFYIFFGQPSPAPELIEYTL